MKDLQGSPRSYFVAVLIHHGKDVQNCFINYIRFLSNNIPIVSCEYVANPSLLSAAHSLTVTTLVVMYIP